MIAIIDYNMGNLASVQNAFKEVGADAKIINNPDDIVKYDKVILPGVGAFGDAMQHLSETDMDSAIKEFAQTGKYMLGVCLGMQLLFEKSEEFGNHKGLSLLDGEVKHFDASKFEHKLKIPHMGWNKAFTKDDQLFSDVKDPYLYFVHSYHVVTSEENTIATTNYGYDFTSIVRKDNIYGIQPHPEKSHENGLKILKNFVEL